MSNRSTDIQIKMLWALCMQILFPYPVPFVQLALPMDLGPLVFFFVFALFLK